MTAPFGIDFFSSMENMEIVNDYGQGKFAVVPPKAHPAFDTYIVQATPGIGIFWIKGITPVIDNDAYGTRANAVKGELVAQLSNRYGHGVAVDKLSYGSIWEQPSEWMRSLFYNERSCFNSWKCPENPAIPDDIDNIF
jgi:hypothetical protein